MEDMSETTMDLGNRVPVKGKRAWEAGSKQAEMLIFVDKNKEVKNVTISFPG